jgi:hypothetical protein
MNLRFSVLLSVWRCCMMITIVYARQLARFPLAPISMIWSFAWESASTRWPSASTALSTHIFLEGIHDSLRSKLCVDGRQIANHAKTLAGLSEDCSRPEYPDCNRSIGLKLDLSGLIPSWLFADVNDERLT